MATRDSQPPLDGTTWKGPAQGDRGDGRAAGHPPVACLTLCDHADLTRVGERVLLPELSCGEAVEVSRLSPRFGRGADDGGLHLADPYVSRTPLVLHGDPARAVLLRSEHDRIRIDGTPLIGPFSVRRDQLARGVTLELDDRVLLLLHLATRDDTTPMDGLWGRSDGIERVRREVRRAAELDVPVLIRGESGSGKEGVARSIHACSARASRPCVCVNMATIPPSTAVSTLFGHVRGAFTGANQRHAGLFEQAHGGTLFLDEIGETPAEIQPMLLRVLETGTLTPLGDTREVAVDVRVVAATDARLELEVERGGFRRALLHRLGGYEIDVPPLRERRDDIAPLFVRFLEQELLDGDRHLLTVDPRSEHMPIPVSSMTRLLAHPFAGNVRELRNLARRLAVSSRDEPRLVVESVHERLARERPASATPLAGQLSGQAGPPIGVGRGVRPADLDDAVLVAALEQNDWSAARAAEALGIAKSTVQELMRKSPNIRLARDIDDAELQQAASECNGDTRVMAARLRVSERSLRKTMRERGLL